MSEAGYTKDKHYEFLLKYFPANKIHFDINEKIALGVFLPRILAEAGLPYTVVGYTK
jgi:hypothetical protein